jgi:hypothetical protein
LGKEHLLPPTARIPLEDEQSLFLEKVAARIELARPAERRRVAGVDLKADFVDVVEDLTWAAPGDEVLAVEIKVSPNYGSGGSLPDCLLIDQMLTLPPCAPLLCLPSPSGSSPLASTPDTRSTVSSGRRVSSHSSSGTLSMTLWISSLVMRRGYTRLLRL